MPKIDPLRAMPPERRPEAIRLALEQVLGPVLAAQAWVQMGPALGVTARQPGDAKDPAQNAWKGAWRIWECDPEP